jgi:cell shape-determining protein MreC
MISRRLDGTLSYFRSKRSLEEENRILKEKLALSEELVSRARTFGEQNEFYQSLLGTNTAYKIGAVLVRPPQSPYDVLIVDKGGNDGVSVGSQVYSPEYILIGSVFEVEKDLSRIRLFSSPGEKVNAVLERHQVPVVLEGNGGGNFKIVLNRDTAVEVGDRIITAGAAAELIAVVGDINMSPTDAHKEVLARLPINGNLLRFVQIR